jgi:hypothetical protein
VSQVRELLVGLIRGGDQITSAEIGDHLERLARLGAELPEGWKSWPEVLRELERDGVVRTEGEGWLVWIVPKPKPSQASLF